MTTRDRLAGRVAIVTGAGRGLGAEISRWLAAAGTSLALCSRSLDEVTALAAELATTGADVLAEACDVADATAVAEFVRHTERRFGRIDVAVANAGILGPV